MNKTYQVKAKDDLQVDVHTWTKGEVYEVVEKSDYLTLASDQGALNYYLRVKKQVLGEFEVLEVQQ
ncbi:hypothetical protein [Terribacillus saccharophilus]|uniref:hypothetical protein n=1 Tax=Terribacillus saccharophilus TaxID=361277 RepID=UPI000BA557FE|nr:hypothetical protein [Terribacillus saccharophilus]PAF19729.1 hypothetical protein CHH51_01315 [Terribacillus saccharophilus]